MKRFQKLCSLVCFILLPGILCPLRALADVGGIVREIDVSAATHLPVSLGVEGNVELRKRVLLRLHLGWMPPGYLSLINETATHFGWYDETTADLVSEAIDNAFVLRLGAGWRPLTDYGWEFTAGYTSVIGSGGISRSEALGAVTGEAVGVRRDTNASLRSTLHAVHVDTGWKWILAKHLLLRASLGFVYTFHARTNVTIEGAPGDRLATASESYLNDILTTYGLSAEAKLAVGYAF